MLSKAAKRSEEQKARPGPKGTKAKQEHGKEKLRRRKRIAALEAELASLRAEDENNRLATFRSATDRGDDPEGQRINQGLVIRSEEEAAEWVGKDADGG